MDVTRLLIALFVGMAVLIFLIMKTRLHPSLSLVISACVVGIVGGVELASIPGLITSGFGNTLAGIGQLRQGHGTHLHQGAARQE